jgi:hypothetical protein
MPSPYTSALTYNLYVTQVATMTVVNVQTVNGVVVGVDDAFNNLIPQMLNYAELRIQRDLDLTQALVTSIPYSLTIGTPSLDIPVDDFVVINTISVDTGIMRMPLMPVTREFLQNVYPMGSTLGTPQFFAITGGDAATSGNTTRGLLFGPPPDIAYSIYIGGTKRMDTLYEKATPALAATGTTYISAQLPDLLLQASMIYISQFQRNFGAASNDPQMGPTYEAQYQNLLRMAMLEEARKRFQAAAWTSQTPAVAASPTRG